MTEQPISPKREKKLKQREEATAYAKEIGLDLDVSDKGSVRTTLLRVMESIGMEPETVSGNKSIRGMAVDANGYLHGKTYLRPDIKAMRAELVRLVRIIRQGGPWTPGDLAALNISSCARAILEAQLGEEWRTTVSREIASVYEKRMGYGKSYDKLNDAIGMKIAQGRILVQASLGRTYYRNGHLIMPQIRLPASTMAGIVGRNASSLMEGDPYGSAFTEATVRHVECPERTTIIHLEETLEPATGRKDEEC